MSVWFDLALYGLFACCCLWGVKGNGSERRDQGFYLIRLNALRGVFALEIVIGHVIRFDNTLLYPLGKFMIISVAFFFFVSAFGMVRSFQTKQNYFQGFLIGKPFCLLLLALAAFAFNFLIDLFCPLELGYWNTNKNFFLTLFEETNWYMIEQMLFYVVFYLVYRYVHRYRVAIVMTFSFLFATVVYLAGSSQGWYSSSLAFPLGLLFGEYFETFTAALKKPWMLVTTVLLALLGLSSLLLGDNLLAMVYLRNVMCIAAVLILLYVTMHLQIGNRITQWLGKYSTEIYLFQFVYLKIADQSGWDYKLRMLMVVSCTLLTAVLMHPVFRMIRVRCGKWSNGHARWRGHHNF